MTQAGLVEAAELKAMGIDGPIAILLRLTWAGHDFVDTADFVSCICIAVLEST
jgi:hypothetical protein